LEQERNRLTGPTALYFSLIRGQNVDALYGEPDNDPLYGGGSPRGTDQIDDESWHFYPNPDDGEPDLEMVVIMEYQEMDNRTPMVREEGFHAEFDAIMHLAYYEWVDGIKDTLIDGRLPKEGDVIYVFNLWWDVVRVGSGGNIADSTEITGYKFELRKRTKFTPDRKVKRVASP
jgi:hypothetical protein